MKINSTLFDGGSEGAHLDGPKKKEKVEGRLGKEGLRGSGGSLPPTSERRVLLSPGAVALRTFKKPTGSSPLLGGASRAPSPFSERADEDASVKFVSTATLPPLVIPIHVPPASTSRPAKMSGWSSHQCVALVGLHAREWTFVWNKGREAGRCARVRVVRCDARDL